MAVLVLLLAAVAGLILTTEIVHRLSHGPPARATLMVTIGIQSLCLLTAVICMMLILLS